MSQAMCAPPEDTLRAALVAAGYQPREFFELSAIDKPEKGSAAPRSSRFAFEDAGVTKAARWAEGRGRSLVASLTRAREAGKGREGGLYLGTNPLAGGDGGRPADADVSCVRVLLIDPDPIDTSPAARAEAARLAGELRALLQERLGVLAPLVDSGRGRQLWLRHESTPVGDARAQRAREGLLAALAARFDTALATIDPSVKNPSRLMRLPGWPNLKTGDVAQLLDAGDGRVAALEAIERLARELSPTPAEAPRGRASPAVDKDGILAGVPEGRRHKELHRLASSLRGRGTVSLREAEAIVVEAAKNCSPPFGEAGARELVTWVFEHYAPNDPRIDEERVAEARAAAADAVSRAAKGETEAPFEVLPELALLRDRDPGCFERARKELKAAKAGVGRLDERLDDHAANERKRAAAHSPVDVASGEAHPYVEDGGRTYEMKRTKEGGRYRAKLSNFTARIVADVVEDDGQTKARKHEVEAAVIGGPPRRFTLTTRDFEAMGWPMEQLGAHAILEPGQGCRDRMRHAVQELSGTIPERVVYTHVGWREIAGRSFYLHAEGAIGEGDAAASVKLTDPMDRFSLPMPPDGRELREAVRASIAMLEVAPHRIMMPLFAAAYRAPLGPSESSLYVVGTTGVLKSSAAALAQRHYGMAMNEAAMPVTWESTGNAIEAMAFAAKDAVIVIDDLVKTGDSRIRAQKEALAERVLRPAANGVGRQRMSADGSMRPTKHARGLIVSTGESLPSMQSLRARMVVVEVGKGDVDVPTLTRAQADADEGRYAAAMAGYLRWLAVRPELRASLRARVAALRSDFQVPGLHLRTADAAASLFLGVQAFCRFAVDVQALDAPGAAQLEADGREALLVVARRQGDVQREADPVERFRELLYSALASGRAHVAGPAGRVPEDPGAWGWRANTDGAEEDRDQRPHWREMGARIGWILPDGRDAGLYLEPGAALLVARGGDETFSGDERSVGTQLRERGCLVKTDQRRQTHKVRAPARVPVARGSVWHLRADWLGASRGRIGRGDWSGETETDHAGSDCDADASSETGRDVGLVGRDERHAGSARGDVA